MRNPTTVTIIYQGRSQACTRIVAAQQAAKAESAARALRDSMAARHAAHAAKPVTSAREQADADARTLADIARYDAIASACRAALV